MRKLLEWPGPALLYVMHRQVCMVHKRKLFEWPSKAGLRLQANTIRKIQKLDRPGYEKAV